MIRELRKTGYGIGALFMLAAIASGQTTTVTYSYSGLPLFIASDAANIITLANVFVPAALAISKVTARVQIQYPNTGDLKIYLYSPDGTRTILLEHDCGVANVDTTFDDAAASNWKDFCPTEAGRGPFKTDQPLSNFNSADSSFGTWFMAVENDTSDSRTGWIENLSLTITGTPQGAPVTRSGTIVNAASLTNAGIVAPGEMVSIFGLNVGPVVGISAGPGALPTSLGGTSVAFNGTLAGISYVSQFRVDVQVPFSLTPGAATTVQLTSNKLTTAQVPITVQATVPGVYTNGIVGTGPASVINQSGIANSKLTPAAKGSIIAVFTSGLGTVNPPLATGAVPPASTLSKTTADVGAFIGGAAALVRFAGAAPGYPGLYQINIEVPANAPSGTDSLLIYANSQPTQSNVTVEIQ
jgi:uncharacterized protein (TIGR03437 family)